MDEVFVSITHILPHLSAPGSFFDTVSAEAQLVFDGAAEPGKHVFKDTGGILMLTFEPYGDGRFRARARMSGNASADPFDGVLDPREYGTVTAWRISTPIRW